MKIKLIGAALQRPRFEVFRLNGRVDSIIVRGPWFVAALRLVKR